jgi:hypothetical protein
MKLFCQTLHINSESHEAVLPDASYKQVASRSCSARRFISTGSLMKLFCQMLYIIRESHEAVLPDASYQQVGS